MEVEKFTYDDAIVKKFIFATMLWGAVGMFIGVLIALQQVYPSLNFNSPWLTYGRLRPLHTNAVIFAFCLNAVFAGIYHSSQRLLKARMFSDTLSRLHFWGWQLIIVLAAVTLPLGFTTSKEYAELEWPIAILIAVVWIIFALNYFLTIAKRREEIIYVSIWFYIATIITVAMLHIVNHLALPVGFLKSYPVYSGVRDALVQWWYGHNAVAFVLTTPFLGLAYYYIPKLVNRPVYSYKLSVVHFWSLIFVYMWAGPHHLLNTSLPQWLQSLGVVFSIMLLAPSWGGGVNFLLTIREAWATMKTHPATKFFVAGSVFYLIAVTEGPLMSLRSVNRISHFTDWTIGHAHGGGLGWNGFIIFGMLYWLVPSLYKTQLYSKTLANLHFWIQNFAVTLYVVSLLIAGIRMGIMREQLDGSVLAYPNFMQIVESNLPFLWCRAAAGVLYLTGTLIGCFVLYKTAQTSSFKEDHCAQAVPYDPKVANRTPSPSIQKMAEKIAFAMGILAFMAVSVGGVIQILPLLVIHDTHEKISTLKPYTPLELEGRDIYIREGCNNCHTQTVRPLAAEENRYGPYSRSGEFEYDFPHLWGSKQTGPDLHRIGGKYNDAWHYKHMVDPRSLIPNSTMPSYPWLATDKLDTSKTTQKLKAMKTLGVPYTDLEMENALADLRAQASQVSKNLSTQNIPNVLAEEEIIALIAYLQRLGTDGKKELQHDIHKATKADTE